MRSRETTQGMLRENNASFFCTPYKKNVLENNNFLEFSGEKLSWALYLIQILR
jgi:hypothetical protein